jgi:methionyl-tRNA synthetase
MPTNVPANEFMNLEGDKMSTSRNWAIQVHKYQEEFPGKEDVLRYVLCANMPETKDSEFTWKDYQARNNNELVAILGNFVNRVIVLTNKYFDGRVTGRSNELEAEENVINFSKTKAACIENYIFALETYRFRDALNAMMDVARAGNKLLTDYEPWKLINSNTEKTGGVLRTCLETLADIAVLCEPFIPFTSGRINKLLKINTKDLHFEFLNDKLTTGASIEPPSLLFEKIEDALIDKRLNELGEIRKNKMENQDNNTLHQEVNINVKPPVQYEDFAKLDIRTGVILEAEKVEGADKLLRLTVDLGFEKRTIVSGIALEYSPEEIIGKQVLVLVNLAPKQMRGVESKGMILMAGDKEENVYFIKPDGTDVPGLIVS